MGTTTRFALDCLVVGCLGVAATEGLANGPMEKPIGRIYRCLQEGPGAPRSAACRALVDMGGTRQFYDRMEFRPFGANGARKPFARNGTRCAGGRMTRIGFNLPAKDWRESTITPNSNGKYIFGLLALAIIFGGFLLTVSGDPSEDEVCH